jgi:hypothetical protein
MFGRYIPPYRESYPVLSPPPPLMLNINKTIVIILLSLNGSCRNNIAMNCQFDGMECTVRIFIIPGMVKITSVQL